MAIFVPLIAWAVWIGVYPKPYFDILRQPVSADRAAGAAGILCGQWQAVRAGSRRQLEAALPGYRECRRQSGDTRTVCPNSGGAR